MASRELVGWSRLKYLNNYWLKKTTFCTVVILWLFINHNHQVTAVIGTISFGSTVKC